MIPPLPPPNGMCATAHFHVIHAASAVTSSSDDVRVIANTALGRTARDVVLHAVAGEHFDTAVVHLDRTRHDDLPFRFGEDVPDAWVEFEDPGSYLEFLQHRVEYGSL